MDLHIEIKLKQKALTQTRTVLEKIARQMRSSAINKIQKTSSPINAPLTIALKGSSKPLRDTGQLMSSINYRIMDDSTAKVGTNRIGARLQQEGGVIKPQKSNLLWIPANKKVKSQLRAYHYSITAYIKALKVSGSVYKKGKAFFYLKKGQKKPEMLFVLKPSVTIPARPYLYCSDKDRLDVKMILKESYK